jgi:hypothetical protein
MLQSDGYFIEDKPSLFGLHHVSGDHARRSQEHGNSKNASQLRQSHGHALLYGRSRENALLFGRFMPPATFCYELPF